MTMCSVVDDGKMEGEFSDGLDISSSCASPDPKCQAVTGEWSSPVPGQESGPPQRQRGGLRRDGRRAKQKDGTR